MSDPVSSALQKCARDVMTAPPVTIGPDDSARHAAELMLQNRISGLPVVDSLGRPLGVVSQSDFRFADLAERRKQRDAWLSILAGGQQLAGEYLDAVEREAERVRHIMASPAISIDEATSLIDAAELLSRHRIRRLLVLREGKVAGVVTRSNLLHFFAPGAKPSQAIPTPAEFDEAIEAAGLAAQLRQKPGAQPAATGVATAKELKQLVADYERDKAKIKASAHAQASEKRNEAVHQLLHARFTEAELAHLMQMAREAARRGETSCPALIFPAALCTDGGRAINLPDPNWPATLRGKAADFFLLWDKDLKPQGFALTARMVSFPDGFPGDAELALAWGR